MPAIRVRCEICGKLRSIYKTEISAFENLDTGERHEAWVCSVGGCVNKPYVIRKKKRFVYRSAETGLYVSKLYALLHPKTTIKERVP